MGYIRALSRLIPQQKRIINNHIYCKAHQGFLNYGYIASVFGVLSKFTRLLATNTRPDVALDEMPYGREFRKTTAKSLSKNRIPTINHQTRTLGRVSETQLRFALEELIQLNEHVSEETALVLMRCTGNTLVSSPLEKRRLQSDETWRKLEELGVVKTTKLYNARLRVMLENDVEFDPSEFLLSMGDVQPNRVTYQLLIARHSKTGNMDEAMRLMQNIVMKTDMVYNRLLAGFLRQGNNSQAADMIQEMSEKGLGPTVDTYAVMIQCHAEKGNIEAMQKVLSTAAEASMRMECSSLLEAAYRLITHGYGHMLKEVIEMMPSTISFNDANCYKNTIYSLAAEGYDDAAHTLFEHLITNSSDSRITAEQYLKNLITIKKSVPQVLKLYDYLVQNKYIDSDPTMLVVNALRYRQAAKAVEYLKFAIEEGHMITIHNFRAMFESCTTKDDVPAIYGFLQVLADRPATRNKFACAYNYGILNLVRYGESCETIIRKLSELNYSKEFQNYVEVMDLVRRGDFAAAAACLNEKPLPRVSPHVSNSVTCGLNIAPENLQDVVPFLSALRVSGMDPATFAWTTPKCVKETIVRIKSLAESDSAVSVNINLERFIQQLKDADMTFLYEFKDGIVAVLPSDISEESLSSFQAMFILDKEQEKRDFSQMSIEELEVEVENGIVDAKRNLLRKYLMNIDNDKGGVMYEKAMALKQELQFENVDFGPVLTAGLIKLSMLNDDLADALQLKYNLEFNHPYYNATTRFSLYLSGMLVKAGRFQDAFKEIESLCHKRQDVEDLKTINPARRWNISVNYLLNNCAMYVSTDELWKVVELLEKAGIFDPGQWNVLDTLMKSYIDGDDMVAAVNMFEKCVRLYKKSPRYSALFRKIIMKDENVALLQRVVDALQEMRPQREVLTDLMFQYIECDKVVFARKLLESPALSATSGTIDINDKLENWIKYNQVHKMETFVNISKQCACVDREDALFYLMRMYISTTGIDSALDVLVTYEEEMLSPRPRTLRYLANVCRTHNIEVPFKEPPGLPAKESDVVASDTSRNQHSELEYTISALQGKEEFYRYLQTHTLNNDELVFLRKRLPPSTDRKSYDNYLVDSYDIKKILDLAKRFPGAKLLARLATRLIEHGKIDELLEAYKESEEMLQWGCPSTVLLSLDEIAPEVSRQVVELIEDAVTTKQRPSYALLHYHCKKNNMEKVQELAKVTLPDINLHNFIRSFRLKFSDLDKLMPIIKDHAPHGKLANVLNALIKSEIHFGAPEIAGEFSRVARDNDVPLDEVTLEMIHKYEQSSQQSS